MYPCLLHTNYSSHVIESAQVFISRCVCKENVVHTHTMKFYSVIKNEIMTSAEKWMELETMKLNRISWTQKDGLQVFSHMWNLHFKTIHIHTYGMEAKEDVLKKKKEP